MNPAPTPALRRLILGSALLLGLVAGLPWKTADVLAQTPAAPSAPVAPVAPTPPSPPATPAAAPVSPPNLDQSPATKTKGDHGITARIEIDTADDAAPGTDAGKDKGDVRHGIVVEKGGKKVRVVGTGDDRQLLEEIAHKSPAVAGTVVGIVAIVFLSPALIVALFIWYRIRKARMLNETLLRLAERGIVPPAEAMQALGAGELPASVANAGTVPGAPLAAKAPDIRTRAAWSDLRKGILAGAVGLGLTLFSMLDDGTPNSIGLILLFVGGGYCVLWWFEARHSTPPTGGSGSTGTGT